MSSGKCRPFCLGLNVLSIHKGYLWWWSQHTQQTDLMGPGFVCMEPGAPDTRIVNSSSGDDGLWAKHGILWWKPVNHHPSISNPQCSRRMAPRQVFRFLLWPSVIGLPSSGLAIPVHRSHIKVGSGSRMSKIPLHFLWTQLEQPSQKTKFVPTPERLLGILSMMFHPCKHYSYSEIHEQKTLWNNLHSGRSCYYFTRFSKYSILPDGIHVSGYHVLLSYPGI